jgi:hypothetical protein
MVPHAQKKSPFLTSVNQQMNSPNAPFSLEKSHARGRPFADCCVKAVKARISEPDCARRRNSPGVPLEFRRKMPENAGFPPETHTAMAGAGWARHSDGRLTSWPTADEIRRQCQRC